LNKVDLTSPEDAFDKAGQLGILDTKRVIPVSATTGHNIEQLKDMIGQMLFETEKAGRPGGRKKVSELSGEEGQ
jgi:50S ribosomal subunit-associated GTPase HflX